jgi:hypothetical protein
MKMAVFWDVAPCHALMMEAVRTSETSFNFYETSPGAISDKAVIFVLAAVAT